MDEIERLIDETIERHKLVGLTCALIDANGGAHFIARGLADIEQNIPVDEHSVFRVASISKTFTAIGLMQLWEQGRFDLDDPANRHLKAYRLSRDDVTVRHLLTHTAGIGEVPSLVGLRRPGAIGMVGAARPLPTLREMYGPVQRVGIAPGTKWAYANHGYATLGQLVEDISRRPFADQLRENVFEAIGMEHTDFITGRVRDRLAIGYRHKRGATVPVRFGEMTMVGGGGLYSCASDMARYVATLSSGGVPLVKPETLDMMLGPQFPSDGGLPAIGLAFWLSDVGGRLVAGHGGDLPGFKSAMRFAPDGPGLFISTNTGGAASQRVTIAIDELSERMMATLLGVPDVPIAAAATGPTDAVGVYRPDRGFLTNVRTWAMFGGELEIVQRNGALHLRSPLGIARRPLPLREAGSRLAFEKDGLKGDLDMQRDRIGRPTGLVLRSSIGFGTFTRRPSSLRRIIARGAVLLTVVAIRRRRRKRRA